MLRFWHPLCQLSILSVWIQILREHLHVDPSWFVSLSLVSYFLAPCRWNVVCLLEWREAGTDPLLHVGHGGPEEPGRRRVQGDLLCCPRRKGKQPGWIVKRRFTARNKSCESCMASFQNNTYIKCFFLLQVFSHCVLRNLHAPEIYCKRFSIWIFFVKK